MVAIRGSVRNLEFMGAHSGCDWYGFTDDDKLWRSAVEQPSTHRNTARTRCGHEARTAFTWCDARQRRLGARYGIMRDGREFISRGRK